MERLKWEYEEEMRVRNEVAELNKKFKSESQDNQSSAKNNPLVSQSNNSKLEQSAPLK